MSFFLNEKPAPQMKLPLSGLKLLRALVLLLIATAIIMALALRAVSFGPRLLISCSDSNVHSIMSPDHAFEARSFSRLCQGPFAVNVDLSDAVTITKAGFRKEVLVYKGNDGAVKALAWKSNKELEIIIEELIWRGSPKLEKTEEVDIRYFQVFNPSSQK